MNSYGYDNVLQKNESAPYIRTKRPVVQIPEEDSFSIEIEGVSVVETTEFLQALDLYFAAVFMFNLSYARKVAKFSTFVQNFWLGMKDSNVTKQMRRLYAQLLRGNAQQNK